MEAGAWKATEEGTPQGGIISPLLANLYLHEVLDKWFAEEIRSRLKGRSFLIRYADDAVMGFEYEEDARRVIEVLPKRFARFGLSLNMQKTRIVDFQKPNNPEGKPGTFDFLGFTHYWGRSRKGYAITKLKTAKDRLARSCKAVWESCRKNMHLPIPEQCRRLNWKLRGHYSYYEVTHNIRALRQYHMHVCKAWHRWLNRRGGQKRINWQEYVALLTRNPCLFCILRADPLTPLTPRDRRHLVRCFIVSNLPELPDSRDVVVGVSITVCRSCGEVSPEDFAIQNYPQFHAQDHRVWVLVMYRESQMGSDYTADQVCFGDLFRSHNDVCAFDSHNAFGHVVIGFGDTTFRHLHVQGIQPRRKVWSGGTAGQQPGGQYRVGGESHIVSFLHRTDYRLPTANHRLQTTDC